MKTLNIALFALVFILSACTADDVLYTDYKIFYKNAFITTSGTILESAAFGDSVNNISDRSALLVGAFEYSDPDEIVRYGHCWAKGNTTPVILGDSSNCHIYKYTNKSNDTFTTLLQNLTHETDYSFRSFIITSNGTVGYNPQITHFTTTEPHDEWFNKETLTSELRSDGVSASTVINGDTITYFGLGRNATNCYNDFYQFNSKTGEISRIRDFPGTARWGAAAFILNYTDYDTKEPVLCLYVGLGCSDAIGKSNYETDFYVYNITNGTWQEVRSTEKDRIGDSFSGAVRTGAVSFALNEFGFVGLGENQNGACHNDFFIFIMERDNNNLPKPNRGYFYTMSKEFEYGKITGASAFVINNQAYIIGGKDNNGKYNNNLIQCILNVGKKNGDAQYYFEWQKKKSFPGIARAFGVATGVNKYGYYGTGENNKQLFNDFYKYDPANDRWTQCTDYKNGEMQTYPGSNKQISSEISRALILTGNDRCYIGAGQTNDKEFKFVNYFWEYRP